MLIIISDVIMENNPGMISFIFKNFMKFLHWECSVYSSRKPSDIKGKPK